MTKGAIKAIAIGLSTLLIGGTVAAGVGSAQGGKPFQNPHIETWFNSWGKPATQAQAQTWGGVIDNVGNELNAETTYAMPAAMAFYAEVAPSDNYDNPTVTVTASHNFEFNNVKVDWSVEYPSGASAGDVVTVTPLDDGSLTAIVSCSAPFDTQLTLKATLRDNEEKTATCTIDYVKRLDDGLNKVRLAGGDFNDFCGVYLTPNYGVGTVTGNISVKTLTVHLNDDFKVAVKSYLKFDITFQTATIYDIPLTYEGSNNSLEFEENYCWNYAMFIKGFDDLDTAHKNAIYYAWFNAWKDNFSDKVSNLYFNLVLDLSYNGTVIQSIYEYDLTGLPNISYLNGDCEGSELSPDLTLNTNVIL